MSDNGVAVTDKLGQTTINVDDLVGQTVSLETPGRVEGVPPVRAAKPRKITWPDKEHYVEVRGGGSNLEALWIEAVDEKFQELVDDGMSRVKASFWRTGQWATFVADRLVDHNFVYADDEPLPKGLEFVWEFGTQDTLYLLRAMQRDMSAWASPKAEATSTTTSSTGDSSP